VVAAGAQDLASNNGLGVTSKPTIEGHFKTEQWAITLDKNLFYRARCGGGNPLVLI
jgi:hypothetical protein